MLSNWGRVVLLPCFDDSRNQSVEFYQDSLLEFLTTAFRNTDTAAYRKAYCNMLPMNRTRQRFQTLE